MHARERERKRDGQTERDREREGGREGASIRRRAGNPYSLSAPAHRASLCRRHRRPRPRGSSNSGICEAIGSSLEHLYFRQSRITTMNFEDIRGIFRNECRLRKSAQVFCALQNKISAKKIYIVSQGWDRSRRSGENFWSFQPTRRRFHYHHTLPASAPACTV